MIPYVDIPPLRLFGLRFEAFGMLVATGFMVGLNLAKRRAVELGLNPLPIYDAAIICILCGFTGAHLMHVFAYEPQMLQRDPFSVFYIWSGISSFGGFLGTSIGLGVYFWRKKLSGWAYGDALMYGLVPGWFFGRLGCFTAHDHPGKPSDFFLAVKYPLGPRHDLGFYDAILTVGILIVIYATKNRPYTRVPGKTIALVLLMYTSVRFFFDFLRATDLTRTDRRYFGLTPAQYCAILFCGLALYVFFRKRPAA